MKPIQYLLGDATTPVSSGPAIIVHVCNDIGGWGAGFVLAISKRWAEPERRYRAWHRDAPSSDPPFELGEVQFVQVASNLIVANLVGQRGIKRHNQLPPIRYDAIDQGLERVAAQAIAGGASVHMPRIGCGLAGGTWDQIEPLILHRLSSRDVPVTVYDFVIS
jgi:O-acetyl-ADP-ribose deacetylase (regulator of RNase III)